MSGSSALAMVWLVCQLVIPSPLFTFGTHQLDSPSRFSRSYQVYEQVSNYCGFGYLPATDDYKVLVAAYNRNEQPILQVRIFSTIGGIWKTIESPFKSSYPLYITRAPPALLGVTLHWLMRFPQRFVIHSFDLVREEYQQMLVFHRLRGIVSCG